MSKPDNTLDETRRLIAEAFVHVLKTQPVRRCRQCQRPSYGEHCSKACGDKTIDETAERIL